MSYHQVTVLVDGAVEDELNVPSVEALRVYVAEIEAEASEVPYEILIYTIFHDHAEDVECICVEYLQDHHPAYTFNKKDNNA